MLPVDSNAASAEDHRTWRELRRIILEILLLLVVMAPLWLGFYYLWKALPYIQNGTDVIVDTKIDVLSRGELFKNDPGRPYRVVVVGDSRILSGFKPDLFDRLSDGKTFSYNMGIPGQSEFVDKVQRMVDAGESPTHLFLLLPVPPIGGFAVKHQEEPMWPEKTFRPTPFKWIQSDKVILEKLFPFRNMARDLMSFLALASTRGGVVSFYEQSAQYAKKTLQDRGYFYIESQKLFPDGHLPEEHRLETDSTTAILKSDSLDTTNENFARLVRAAEQHAFRIYFIPGFVREKSFGAPPPINEKLVEAAKPFPVVGVIGPDYFRYPNRFFSDAVHVNPDGADLYTADLWNATRHLFAGPPKASTEH